MGIESKVTESHNVFKGEDKELQFTVYLEGTTENQIASDPTANRQNISGWGLEWGLAHKAAHAPMITKRAATGGITVTDAPEGELTVSIESADTLNIATGTYHHTLWREDPGSKTVLSFGPFALKDPVEET